MVSGALSFLQSIAVVRLEIGYFRGERAGIAVGEDIPECVAHRDLGRPLSGADGHRHPRCHRLGHGQREAFVARGLNKEVVVAKMLPQIRLVAFAEQPDAFAYAVARDKLFELLAPGPSPMKSTDTSGNIAAA